ENAAIKLLDLAQIECKRELRINPRHTGLDPPRSLTDAEEARQAAAFGLKGADWAELVVASRRGRARPLEGRVSVAGRPGAPAFLAQHMPGLQGAAQLHIDAAGREVTVFREAELEVRRGPARLAQGGRVVSF